MKHNQNLINEIIKQNWGDYKQIELDKDTKAFIEIFLREYYERILKGMMDKSVPVEIKKKMLYELKQILDDKCELCVHISNCISNYCSDNEVILINDIFKLIANKQIEY